MPNGSSVATLDLIVVYLQARFGVHARFGGGKHIAVALVSHSERSFWRDHDASVKYTLRGASHDIAEHLVAVTSGYAVVDGCVAVYMFAVHAYCHAGQKRLGMLADEIDGKFVARHSGSQGCVVVVEARVLVLLDVGLRIA